MAKTFMTVNPVDVSEDVRKRWEIEHNRPLPDGMMPFEGSPYDPRSPQQIAEARRAAEARTVR